MTHTKPIIKKPIKFWTVVENKKVVYQSNFVTLCQNFIKVNALNGAKLKAVY